MKISLNTAQFYSNVDLKLIDTQLMLDKIGSQLGAIEEVVDWAPKYQGVVVVKVVKCDKHPNADKLNVCIVDDGGVVKGVERDRDGYVQVVCGAPNVRAGLTVAWIPPGATVPSSYDDAEPFVLGARELRGVISNGMLASAKELAVSDDHNGILEINPNEVGEALSVPGTPFGKLYNISDLVIDVENKMFTHRPDCFGVLGVARELAGINGLAFESPDWYLNGITYEAANDLPLKVSVECPDVVPRFMAVALKDITVGPSPVWMRALLARVGIKSINNVVDVTNFVMYLTGQPLHAYDYDKIKARSSGVPTLVARLSEKSDSLLLLNGKTATFDQESHRDIVIATDKELVGIGGVMGGADTEVDESTTSIILEVATFDMYSVRRTSMKHGLFTDAVTRNNKGQSPLQNSNVLTYAIKNLIESCGASVASEIIDVSSVDTTSDQLAKVIIESSFINERLGVQLAATDILQLLKNVEFEGDAQGETLNLTAPFWRTDIEIPEDIVEEVGRLYGYDKLPLDLPRHGIAPAVRNEMLELKQRIRKMFSKTGANELLTYSFVHGNLIDKVGQDASQAFEIGNALSPDLQYYRMSVLPSLLDKVHMNVKAGHDEFALYELGRAHHTKMLDDEGLPLELERIAYVYAADAKKAKQTKAGAPYYQAKHILDTLLAEIGTSMDVTFRALTGNVLGDHAAIKQMCEPFEPARSAVLWNGEMVVGVVGEFKASVRKALKLPDYCAGFETFHRFLAKQPQNDYVALPRFPKVEQDICLRVPSDVAYQDLFTFAWQHIEANKAPETLASLSSVDIYQRDDQPDHKQITLRLSIASYEKTLRDTEVSQLLDGVAAAAASEFGAELI